MEYMRDMLYMVFIQGFDVMSPRDVEIFHEDFWLFNLSRQACFDQSEIEGQMKEALSEEPEVMFCHGAHLPPSVEHHIQRTCRAEAICCSH